MNIDLKKLAAQIAAKERENPTFRERIFGDPAADRGIFAQPDEAHLPPKIAGEFDKVLPIEIKNVYFPLKTDDDFLITHADPRLLKEVHAELVDQMTRTSFNFADSGAMTQSTAAGAEVQQRQAMASLETFREMVKKYKYQFRGFTVSPKGYSGLIQSIPPPDCASDSLHLFYGLVLDPFGGLPIHVVENQTELIIKWEDREAMNHYIDFMNRIRTIFRDKLLYKRMEYQERGYPLGKSRRGFKKWLKRKVTVRVEF